MLAVELQSVSKIYRMYAHPKDRLKELLFRSNHHVPFAALNDITFGIERGETFGVIGENGAGKSTLLKALAGTITPTRGSITVRGRVAALLELGAGFHPDFSGEENIFLNAALIGLTRKEIEDRLDDIVSFAELGDFIYRPVRIYSSGMYVRLAFSIATSVDPDILIVDEALSVGDQHFQKKSIDRLMGFRKAGKTIVFCAHNMYQITHLCKRAMWLKNGAIAAMGEAERVVAAYESYQSNKRSDSNHSSAEQNSDQYGREVKITKVEILDAAGKPIDKIKTFEDLSVRIGFTGVAPKVTCQASVIVSRSDRVNCFLTGTHLEHMKPFVVASGETRSLLVKFPAIQLLSGEYVLCVYLTDEHGIRVFDLAEYVCPFFVSYGGGEMGMSYMEHSWEEER